MGNGTERLIPSCGPWLVCCRSTRPVATETKSFRAEHPRLQLPRVPREFEPGAALTQTIRHNDLTQRILAHCSAVRHCALLLHLLRSSVELQCRCRVCFFERLTPCPTFTGPGGSSSGDGESCHGQDLKSRKLCLPTGLESTNIGSLPESPVTGYKVLSVTAVLPAAPCPFCC